MYISYDYYRIFYYVASCGSVSRAAAELRNNQPNLTRAIKNLETGLGCALFLRTNRGMKLTPEGERLFAHIRVAFQQIERGETELQELRELRRGSVTIAASEIALRSMLLPVLQEFRRLHPDITLKISNHTTPQAIEALRSGLVDIAVVTTPLTPEDGLSIHALRSVRERAVCAGFPELCGRPVAPEELLRYPIVSLGTQSTSYQLYAGFFATHGLRFFPDIEAATADQILPLVEAGLGIGFVTEDFLQNAPGLHVLELTSPLPAREICAVKRTGQPLSLAAQEMEKMLLRDEPQETSKTGGK